MERKSGRKGGTLLKLSQVTKAELDLESQPIAHELENYTRMPLPWVHADEVATGVSRPFSKRQGIN